MNKVGFVLVTAVFLDMLGFGMLIPGVQLRLEAMGAVGWMIGLVQSSTFVIQTGVSPYWGRLGDRIGRKSVFVWCTLLSALSMGVYAVAPGILWIALSRIIAGFGGANVSAAQAVVAGTVEDRTANLARLGAALSAGLVMGPALGGFVAKFAGAFWVGVIACAASLAGALLALALLPKDKPSPSEPGQAKIKTNLLRDHSQLRALVVIAAVAWFSLSCLEGTFGRLIHAQHGFGELEFGMLFGFESAVALVVQGFLMKDLAKRVGENKLLVGGFALQGLGLALTPLAPGLAALFGTSFFYSLGSSVANPTLQSRASKLVDESRHGELFGLMQSARSIGFVLGPSVGGVLFDWYHPLPYFLAGGVCLVASVLVPLTVKRAE